MNPYMMSEPEITNPNKEEKEESIPIQTSSNSSEMPACPCFRWLCTSICNIPLFTKIIVLTLITLYILTQTIHLFGFYYVSYPDLVFDGTEIPRIFTGSFIFTHWSNLALVLIFWVPKVFQLEKSIGTIRYTFMFCVNTIGIQLIYVLVSYINYKYIDRRMTHFPGENRAYWYSVGLLPYALMELTIDCLANLRSSVRFSCFSLMVHPIFPLAILSVLCWLINWCMHIQLTLGVIYGIVYYYCFRSFCYFKDESVSKLEKCCCCRRLIGKCGFITVNEAGKYDQTQVDLYNNSGNQA